MSQFNCPHGLSQCLNSSQCADRTARALSQGNNSNGNNPRASVNRERDTCPSCNFSSDICGPLLWIKHKHMVCEACSLYNDVDLEALRSKIRELEAENAKLLERAVAAENDNIVVRSDKFALLVVYAAERRKCSELEFENVALQTKLAAVEPRLTEIAALLNDAAWLVRFDELRKNTR